MKKYYPNIKWEWFAQSLKPKHSKNKMKYKDILFDQYNLQKNNPKRWLWGKDNTGDITNIDNILYYKQYCEDVNVITSDCGLYTEKHEYLYKHQKMAVINFSHIFFVLYNLSKGGNFVIKIFLPFTLKLTFSLLYILYISFNEMYFYKSNQNYKSLELYVIGKGYKGISDKKLEYYQKLKKIGKIL